MNNTNLFFMFKNKHQKEKNTTLFFQREKRRKQEGRMKDNFVLSQCKKINVKKEKI